MMRIMRDAAANASCSTTRRMINWENRYIENREYNIYFEGLPSIGFTLVDHMGFLAPLQKQMLNIPKLFVVCKWSIDLNTIDHKSCGAGWLSGRHQCAYAFLHGITGPAKLSQVHTTCFFTREQDTFQSQ